MVNVINGKTANELVYNCLEQIIMKGNRSPSRNGDISTIYNAFCTIENPRARHLALDGRKNNIIANIAEMFWVFSGDDKIDPLLSFFLPRAKDFSDDGITWRGAYGPRLFGENEALDDLVKQFKTEGIFTRRGVMSIFNPDLDTQKNLVARYELEHTKDRPCFVGDTLVFTNSGYKEISKITDNDLVYSYNEKEERMELKKVLWSGKTNTVDKIYKITLSDNTVVEMTEDHLVYMKRYSYDGRARQPYEVYQSLAKDLSIGEYILSTPIHEERMEIKKFLRKNKSFENLIRVHRDSYEYYNGEIPPGYAIHHKNEDHNDNSKGNLQLLTTEEHNRHHKLKNNPSQSYETRTKKINKQIESPGYSHGLMWNEYTQEDILNYFKENIQDIPTLSYDWCNTNLAIMDFPSLTRVVRLFGSWSDFKIKLRNLIGDHAIFEKQKSKKTPTQERRFLRIRNIEILEKKTDVYDITVEDNHNFVLKSGGWIVHNCNLLMDFFATPDKRLHMNLKQRSGDVLWGFGSVNLQVFTALHEVVLNLLRAEVDSELTLGEYNHHVTNLHLYDFSGQQGYDVLENKLKQKLGVQNYQRIYVPNAPKEFIEFNKSICEVLTFGIQNTVISYEYLLSNMALVFGELAFEENLYWTYAKVCCAYICAKNMHLEKGEITDKIVVDLSSCDEEFKQSIRNSSFRKFEIKE